MRRPVPVIPHRVHLNDDAPPEGFPTMLREGFDEGTTARLQGTTRRLGVTLNDLLLTDLFLALTDWRSRQEIEDGGWLRTMIPVNLRTAGDERLPAANVVGSVFLDRRQADCVDPARLLQSVHQETAFVKRWGLGRCFVALAGLCQRRPGRLQRMVRADKCRMSLVFSNIGEPLGRVPLPRRDGCLVAGDVTLEEFHLLTVPRPYSCLALSATRYANKLNFTLGYDPRALAKEQATEFLDTYAQRVRCSAARSDLSDMDFRLLDQACTFPTEGLKNAPGHPFHQAGGLPLLCRSGRGNDHDRWRSPGNRFAILPGYGSPRH